MNRAGQDEFALRSQERAAKAQASGRLADEIVAGAPMAVAQTKTTLRTSPANLDAALAAEAAAQALCYGTDDMGEAVAAFRARRKPVFTGS